MNKIKISERNFKELNMLIKTLKHTLMSDELDEVLYYLNEYKKLKTDELELIKLGKFVYGNYAYDELSDYGKGVRDLLNLFDDNETITTKDIIKQINIFQKIKNKKNERWV